MTLIRLNERIKDYRPDEDLIAGCFRSEPTAASFTDTTADPERIREMIATYTFEFTVYKDGDVGFIDDVDFIHAEQTQDILLALHECGISNPNFGGV